MKNLTKQVVVWAMALACPLMFTSCDDLFGEWDNPTPATPNGAASITINMTEIDAAHLTADKTEVKMRIGEQLTLTFTIQPESLADSPVTLTSADPSIVTVSGHTISAVAPGQTTVTAQVGDQTATCSVTVENTTVSTISGTNGDITYGGGGNGPARSRD